MAEINSSHPSIGKEIGYVVSGGLKENLSIRLTVPAQQVLEGSFVVIKSGDWQFYGIAVDLLLGTTDPRFADEPSETRLPQGLAELLHGQTLFTNLVVMPALMLEIGPDPASPRYAGWRAQMDSGEKEEPRPMPVKTLPAHHAAARLAGAADIAEIFGKPGKESNFSVGTTREQDHPVCINLEKFIQRSAGIFGATGTGKSFLTRILAAGLIKHDRASLLIYDMHNEYGLDDTASDTGEKITGLRRHRERRHDPRYCTGFQPGFRVQRHHARGRGVAKRRTQSAGDHRHHAGCAGAVVWPEWLVSRIQEHETRRNH